MRTKICIQAAFVAAILGACPNDHFPGPFGIGPAEAKNYYTRKRVNGRWITGRFPKRSTNVAKVPARTAPTAVAQSAPAPPPPAARPPQNPPVPVNSTLQERNRLMPLQRALEERARSMALREPWVTPNIRSVTYDFDQGRKTIIFLNGTVTEEPLDPIATGQIDPRR